MFKVKNKFRNFLVIIILFSALVPVVLLTIPLINTIITISNKTTEDNLERTLNLILRKIEIKIKITHAELEALARSYDIILAAKNTLLVGLARNQLEFFMRDHNLIKSIYTVNENLDLVTGFLSLEKLNIPKNIHIKLQKIIEEKRKNLDKKSEIFVIQESHTKEEKHNNNWSLVIVVPLIQELGISKLTGLLIGHLDINQVMQESLLEINSKISKLEVRYNEQIIFNYSSNIHPNVTQSSDFLTASLNIDFYKNSILNNVTFQVQAYIPKSVFFEGLLSFFKKIGGYLTILALLAISLALYLSRFIIKPFNDAINIVSAFSEGNYNVKFPNTRFEEFQELFNTLKTMSTKILQQFEDIKQKTRLEYELTTVKAINEEKNKLIKELELRNLELESITNTFSHDLKTPLITIKGFLGFLQNDLDNKNFTKIKEDINHIVDAVNKMHKLLEDLLKISKLHVNFPQFEFVNVNEIIKEILDMFKNQITQKGINVKVEILPSIVADKNHIKEVFYNLIENAIKYMGDQKTPLIEISGKEVLGGIIYEVKDNGIGIEEQYHQKIFNVFEKLDVNSEGSGIGLAKAKKILSLYQGNIWVESEGAYKGSSFKFLIPYK